MDVQTEREALANGSTPSAPASERNRAAEPAEPAEPTGAESLSPVWVAVGTLVKRWRLIAQITAVAAVAAVVIALLLPRYYGAEARVLQPEGGAFSLLGLVNQATGGLGGLLGGAGGEYTRYLAILTSRSMMEAVVEEFDLVAVYDLEDADDPAMEAIGELVDNVEFEVSLDYNYLAVRAFDQDPERAAAMANFLVAKLNEVNADLSAASARQTRVLVENRLGQAEADLDSVRAELQRFQEEYGVVELESQAQAVMGSVAELKGEVAQLEVRYRTLAGQYGPDNPQVEAARQAWNAARAQVSAVLGGSDELLPVSMGELPALTREYAQLLQDQLIQARIIETVYPLYEQALFQEQNDAEAVQVVDEAVPPVLPARPSRRLVVVGATLTALFLACAFVLAQAWLRRHREALATRLQQVLRAA